MFENQFSGLMGMNRTGRLWNLTGEFNMHLENLIKLEENEMVKIQSLIDPFSENLLEKNIRKNIPSYSQKNYSLYTDYDEFLKKKKLMLCGL